MQFSLFPILSAYPFRSSVPSARSASSFYKILFYIVIVGPSPEQGHIQERGRFVYVQCDQNWFKISMYINRKRNYAFL